MVGNKGFKVNEGKKAMNVQNFLFRKKKQKNKTSGQKFPRTCSTNYNLSLAQL